MGQKERWGIMFCSVCGRKLEKGEVCLCEFSEEGSIFEKDGYFSDKPVKKEKPFWKKILTGILAGILSGVISFTVVYVVFPMIQEKINGEEVSENGDVDVFEGIDGEFILASSEKEYTEGSVSGSAYSNPWANIAVTLDERFKEGTEEDYASYESFRCDCGAYFIADDDNDELTVLFYDAGNMTVREYAEDCLDLWENSAKEMIADTYSESFAKDITYRREARVIDLAGEKYLAVFLITEKDGENFVVYGDFCAMKDGRIIDICFSSDNVEECLEIARAFKNLKAEEL